MDPEKTRAVAIKKYKEHNANGPECRILLTICKCGHENGAPKIVHMMGCKGSARMKNNCDGFKKGRLTRLLDDTCDRCKNMETSTLEGERRAALFGRNEGIPSEDWEIVNEDGSSGVDFEEGAVRL